MKVIEFKSGSCDIQVVDEGHISGSVDVLTGYEKAHLISDPDEIYKCAGIVCVAGDNNRTSCLVYSSNHGMLDTKSVLVIENNLIVAVGNQVCCVSLPELDLKWHVTVDMSTVFAIYVLQQNDGFVTHGELDISRVSFEGKLIWRVSGKDIFTEGFELFRDHVEVVDFNKEKYRIEIGNGRISLLSNLSAS